MAKIITNEGLDSVQQIDISKLDITSIQKILKESKNHDNISRQIKEILNIEGGKNVLRGICKEYIANLVNFDTQNIEQVSMVQILAKTFGLDVFMDGLYGRQTKEVLENILRLNSIEPPIIVFPKGKIDESKLANYRRGKDEDKAVDDLKKGFLKIQKDPNEIKKFEDDLNGCKIDISNLKNIKEGKVKIQEKEKRDLGSDKQELGKDSIGKNLDIKEGNEILNNKELRKIIENAITENFSLSIVQATYNPKEGAVYIIEEGNPESPIILDINKLKNENKNLPMDEAISKELENVKNKFETFVMPSWGNEKGSGQMSAKGILDMWSDKPLLETGDKIKIQKLKNVIKTIEKLDIKSEYKINLINKYINDGSDVSARLSNVIKTLQNLPIVKASIGNNENLNLRLDKHIETYTLFQSSTKNFLENINSIIGGNIIDSRNELVTNKEYTKSFLKLENINPDLSKAIQKEINEEKGILNTESLTSILSEANLAFIKEYCDFLKLENTSKYNKETKDLLGSLKKGLDNKIVGDQMESALEFFYRIKDCSNIEENQVLSEINRHKPVQKENASESETKKYKSDLEMYNKILKNTNDTIALGNIEYVSLIKNIHNFGEANQNISNLDIKNSIIKKGLGKFKSSLIKGNNNARDVSLIKKLDDSISIIETEKGEEFFKNTLRIQKLINQAFSGDSELSALANNLEYISKLPIYENPEIYERLITFSLNKGGYFANGNKPYTEIMDFYTKKINEFKSTSYDFVSKEDSTTIMIDLAKGEISEHKFNKIISQFNEMKAKIAKGEMTIENAKKIVSSLISEKINFNGDYSEADKSDEEGSVIVEMTHELGRIERGLLIVNSPEKKSALETEFLKSKVLLKDLINKKGKARKLSTDTLNFILNTFTVPENKSKFIIPDGIFENDKDKLDYNKAIENSLMNGEINHKDVKYIFETLFNKSSVEFLMLNKLGNVDKSTLLSSLVSGTISYEPELSHMEIAAGAKKKSLPEKMSFILNNYERLDALNTIPNGVNKANYAKHIPNIRASFFGGYLASEEQLSFKLKTYAEGKLDKHYAGEGKGESEKSLSVYSKWVDPKKDL